MNGCVGGKALGDGSRRRGASTLPGGEGEGGEAEEAGVEVDAHDAEQAGLQKDDVAGEGTEVEDGEGEGEGEQPRGGAAAAGAARDGVDLLQEQKDGSEKDDEVVGPGDGGEEGEADEGEHGAERGGGEVREGGVGLVGDLRDGAAAVDETTEDDGKEDQEISGEADGAGKDVAGEFIELIAREEAAHAPSREGLVVGGDKQDAGDAVEVCEIDLEESGSGEGDGGEEKDGGADGHAGGGAVATGEEPIEDQEAGGDLDGGGEGEEGSGGEGTAAFREDEAGDGEQKKEDVRLHEKHGVAEGLAAGEQGEDDGEGRRD